MRRSIVFLSDYGLEDEFVGICHGVIARVSPDILVIDLLHSVPRHDVLRGATLLREALRFMPHDAVFLAVVDPGVGTARRGLAVRTSTGTALVGPDNGLLSLAWQALGGATLAVEIASADVVLSPASETFHGRDVFAPAAARLAAGMALEDLGPPVDVPALTEVRLPVPRVEAGLIECHVLAVDRFGNLQLNVRNEDLVQGGIDREREMYLRARGGMVPVKRGSTFADVEEGAYGAILDSAGWLAIVRNRASAADGLGISPGDGVTLAAR